MNGTYQIDTTKPQLLQRRYRPQMGSIKPGVMVLRQRIDRSSAAVRKGCSTSTQIVSKLQTNST